MTRARCQTVMGVWLFCQRFSLLCRLLRSLLIAAALTVLMSARSSFAGDGIEQLLQETHWGESSGELRSQFGDAAKGLPNAPDFGDSYVDTVLTHQTLGGVPMVVFLQWIRQRTVFHRGRSRYVFRYELPSLSLSLSVSSPPV